MARDPMRRVIACMLALHMLFISLGAQAQSQWQQPTGADVVILKDGSKIRGTLTELKAGDHATVQLVNGQYATIQWGVIDHLERNGAPLAMPGPATGPAAPAGVTLTPPPVAGATGAPPAAGAPGATAAPAAATTGPATLPYDGDDAVPPGYHVKKKVRLGLLITGSVLTAIGLIGIGAIESGNGGDKGAAATVWGVLFLGPGLPLLLVGLISRSKSLVRDDVAAGDAPAPKPSPWYVGVETTAQKKGLTLGVHF